MKKIFLILIVILISSPVSVFAWRDRDSKHSEKGGYGKCRSYVPQRYRDDCHHHEDNPFKHKYYYDQKTKTAKPYFPFKTKSRSERKSNNYFIRKQQNGE
jgi:uncharacterized protein YxeA